MAARGASVRIIGGEWRGRRLPFEAVAGLRPTPDRVRETLFNWLQGELIGRRCLDLFAGSGALGFEAASRGAAEVWLVERDRRVARRLQTHCESLAGPLHLIQGDALRLLQRPPERPFHGVFLDPPFGQGLMEPLLEALFSQGWLEEEGWLYCETERQRPAPGLPRGWHWAREKTSGDVSYRLARPRGD